MEIGGLPAALSVITKVIDILRNRAGEKGSVNQELKLKDIDSVVMQHLIAMDESLAKTLSCINIYSKLIERSRGEFKVILIEHMSDFFITDIDGYLKDFLDNLQYFNKSGSQVGNLIIQSIKGNECAGIERYETDLSEELRNYNNIRNSGATILSRNISELLGRFYKLINCYLDGIKGMFKELSSKKK